MVPVENLFDVTQHFKQPKRIGGVRTAFYCPRCNKEMVSYFTAIEALYIHTCRCGVVFHGLRGKPYEIS